MSKVILLFQSTRQVICAEKLCNDLAISSLVIPVPRSISSECGMALEIEDSDSASIAEKLGASGIEAKIFSGEYKK